MFVASHASSSFVAVIIVTKDSGPHPPDHGGLGLERQRPSLGLDDNKMMIGIGIYEHMPTLKSRDKSCEAGEWLKATTPCAPL